MSGSDDALLRKVTQEVLAELLPDLLEEALVTGATNGGNGHRAQPTATAADGDDAVVPQVPAPPIAKVHRPSGWREPEPPPAEAPAEPSAPGGGATFERVAIRSDADLDAFARELARRLERPLHRKAILSGEVRFRLADSSAASPSVAPVIRVDAGAVTERAVKDAAHAGARLVLSPRAVLTPLARDRARSLGVEIEKEARC